MRKRLPAFLMMVGWLAAWPVAADEEAPAGPDEAEDAEQPADTDQAESTETKLHWRDDPSVKRRPGSYLAGTIGYMQSRAWVEANKEHDDLEFGPLHTFMGSIRVGDAFTEWFALGFQVGITNGTQDKQQVGAFTLLLDTTFYPVAGFGVRPAVGLGLGFANGEKEWEFGGGGPGCLSLSLVYEFRITRRFVLAPVVQTFYIGGGEFDGLFLFFGLEIMRWFDTATG